MREALEAEWSAWLDTRPPRVREIARRFRPWLEYQFKDTKRLCHVQSFNEDENGLVTLKVVQPNMTGLPFDDLVFGVSADNIEPADESCVRPQFKTELIAQ